MNHKKTLKKKDGHQSEQNLQNTIIYTELIFGVVVANTYSEH